MYLEHGSYYFRAPRKPRTNLGRDLGDALAAYASLFAASWSGTTLGDVIDRYRLEVLPKKRSEKTRDDQAKQLDRLKIGFGHFLPDNMTAKHCYKYADARRSKDGERVPVAARHEIGLLRHVFSKAIEWGVTDRNPVRDVRLARNTEKRRQILMTEVEALKAVANSRMAAAIDLAVSIGQRRGDLLTLKHKDLDDELHIQQSKTGAAIDMERSADFDAIVARLKAFKPDIPNEHLIRKRNGRPYTANGFSSNWQRLMRKHLKAGGQHFTFHDLRSVSADGADTVEEAQARLGHASPETTKRFYWKNATKAKPRS